MPIFKESDLEFTPQEIEFFAEDELITIRPNFTLETPGGRLPGLETDYGPFDPHRTLEVPLWMAIALHKRKRCDILRPTWMAISNLEDVFEQEKREAAVFQPLPLHYIELAQVLFRNAKDAFGADFYRTRDLVDSIRKLRMHKVEEGLKVLEGPITVKLTNLAAMECNVIRPFFQGALDRFYQLSKMHEETALGAQYMQADGTGGSSTYGTTGTGSALPSREQAAPPRQLRRGE